MLNEEPDVIRLKDKSPETIEFLKSVADWLGASSSINSDTRAMHGATRKIIWELLEKGEIAFTAPLEPRKAAFWRASFNLVKECGSFPMEEFQTRMGCYITFAKALKDAAT